MFFRSRTRGFVLAFLAFSVFCPPGRAADSSGELIPSLRPVARAPDKIGYQAVEIHLPWADAGHMILRFPETLHSNLGLLFIDHVRSDMPPVVRAKSLPQWTRDATTGSCEYSLELPNDVTFGARAIPTASRVDLEFWVKNETPKPLTSLSAQFCLVETHAPPFNAKDLTRTFILSGGQFVPLARTKHENMSPGLPPWIIASVKGRGGPRPGQKLEGAWSVCEEVADAPLIGTTDASGSRAVMIRWEKGRSVMSNGRIPCLHADPRIPDCPPGETVSVRGSILLFEGDLPGPEETAAKLERQPRALPSSEVRPHGGAPTLFINDRPHSGLSYMTYRPTSKYFRQFGEAGIHLYSFSATPTESGYRLALPCWVAPDRFDFTGMDNRAAMVLGADPEAWFFPRLYLNSPSWWDTLHPDELVTYDPGDGKPVPFFHGGNRTAGKRVPSWASRIWREDTARALRRFIRHVESSAYGDRVIGYHLASGTTEEWMQWGSNENQWVDYGPANVKAFRRWLRDRYDDQDRLRAAWGDPAVTFDTARIPPRRERAAREVGFLRDPARARRSIDYALYNSWLVADTVRYFAGVVKEATHRRALVGVFYGYVLQLAGGQREQNAGHLALGQVLNCPDIDFVTSPTSYAFRALGTGYSHFMSLTDSIKLHGKLWFDENDIRTWLTRGVQPGQWGKTATFEESLLCQQREFANVLAQGSGMWWFDMSSGWYDHPGMLAAIERMGEIGTRALDWDRSPVAEIAFVVDDKSSAYLSIPYAASRRLLVDQLPVLGRMGAPFATIHLADLGKAPPYKLLIFPNTVAPTREEREAIAKATRRPGRLALFQLAPGLVRAGALDEDAMEELTGIRLRLVEETRRERTQLLGDITPWTEGVTKHGTGRPCIVTALPDDREATVIGRSENGAPTVVVKKQGKSTSFYSATPIDDPVFLRNLARQAGVHLYTEVGDVVWANRSILAVSVNEGGPRTINLPERATVTELYTARRLGERIESFSFDFPARGTGIFHLERE